MRWMILVFVFSIIFSAFSRDNKNKPIVNIQNNSFLKTTDFGDEPSPVMLSWIGTGSLGQFTISNTGQNGYFEPPAGWKNYDGVFPSGYFSGNGNTGEFPRGSQQYYIWSSGIWIGAKVRQIIGTDTIYVKRVATGGYYSDQGALSDLYQTNQVLPSGFDGEGDFLFKQKGVADINDYQRLWIYADTSINDKRIALGFDDLLIDPGSGDYLSNEDTYCVWGDYFPENEARTLFTTGYDTDPVGIRVEQRTYSWSTDAFIYLNYRITNMNDFPLEDVYFGYFMDNDIGDAADDLIGYDANLNLGYSYDSDLQETGWKTLAGYMGTVFVETPKDEIGDELGLTGFQTWTIDGDEQDVDNNERDDLKYDQLAKGGYEIFTEPQDVRQLAASGPYKTLMPGETVEVTIAVVAGGSLAEIRENTLKAYDRYDLAYVGPEPPPSPNLTLVPGDKRVIVSWDDFPESIADPFSGKVDFEGYRIYRSDDGGLSWGTETDDTDRYPQGYIPIAEFDIAGNSTGRFTSVSYFSGTSKASIKFEGFTNSVDDFYNESEYTIELLPGRELLVYNLRQFKSYAYNKAAVSTGEGFAIIDRNTNAAYDDPIYVSNALISFDGIYISIKDDTTDNVVSKPNVGDVFKIQTFESTDIGDQTGIKYVFEDPDLINGFNYSYSVTAFDAGDPTTNLPSLESSLFSNRTDVIPSTTPSDRTLESIGLIERTSADRAGNGSVSVVKTNPLEMVTADFSVEFFSQGEQPVQARYMRIVNLTADTVVVDSLLLQSGVSAYSFYGINLSASGPARPSIDTTTFDWKAGSSSSYFFNILANNIGPYNYEVEFVNDLTADTYSGDTLIFPEGAIGPWKIRNLTLDKSVDSYAFPLLIAGNKFADGGNLRIMKENYQNLNDFSIGIGLNAQNTSDPIQAGDVWVVNSVKPFLNGEEFAFSTQAFNAQRPSDDYTLKEIKVVPNPYYIRASWDTDRFNKHLNFTHLPEKCTIRIFTTSGILIETMHHDEMSGDPSGYHSWNLRNKENLDIASGLYIFQVKDLNSGKTKVGKFAVVL